MMKTNKKEKTGKQVLYTTWLLGKVTLTLSKFVLLMHRDMAWFFVVYTIIDGLSFPSLFVSM